MKTKVERIYTVESNDPTAMELATSIVYHDLDKFKAIVDGSPELLGSGNIFTVKEEIISRKYSTQASYEHIIAIYGFSQGISYITDNNKYSDWNCVGKYGVTPLMFAAENGNTEIVEKLISLGANINKANKYGYTPLMFAAKNGYTETVEKLLSLGANVNKANTECNEGDTPLMLALLNDHTEIINILIAAGADVNHVNKETGDTPLMYAAMHGHTEIAEKLIAAGADVNEVHSYFGTPLARAVENGNTETVEKLLSFSADVNKASNQGETPLMIAAREGYIETVKKLIAHGADVNKANNSGHTPLLWAALRSRTDIAKLLIASGADKLTEKWYVIEPIMSQILEAQEYIDDLLEGKQTTTINFDATIEEMLLARVENCLSKLLKSGKFIDNINSIKATFEGHRKTHPIADKVLTKVDDFIDNVLDKDAEGARSLGLSFPQSLKDTKEMMEDFGDNTHELSEKLLRAYDNHKNEPSVIERLNEHKASFESYLDYKKSYLAEHPEHNLSEIPNEILPKLNLLFSNLLQLEGMNEFQSVFDEAPLLEESILFYCFYPKYQLPGSLMDNAQ